MLIPRKVCDHAHEARFGPAHSPERILETAMKIVVREVKNQLVDHAGQIVGNLRSSIPENAKTTELTEYIERIAMEKSEKLTERERSFAAKDIAKRLLELMKESGKSEKSVGASSSSVSSSSKQNESAATAVSSSSSSHHQASRGSDKESRGQGKQQYAIICFY